jgi:hypothetical protein
MSSPETTRRRFDEFRRIVADFLARVDAGRWPTRDPRPVRASITGMR